MSYIHYTSAKKQHITGFTIVELLIVIVVIAILAAITIVAYRGIQDRANDAIVQNDLSAIAKKMALFRVDKDRYPNSVPELASLGIDISNQAYAISPNILVNLGYCYKSDYSDYAVFAMSKSGARYYIRETGGPTVDMTDTTWSSETAMLTNQCGVLGMGVLSHGYVISDSTGPWRAWAGGN